MRGTAASESRARLFGLGSRSYSCLVHCCFDTGTAAATIIVSVICVEDGMAEPVIGCVGGEVLPTEKLPSVADMFLASRILSMHTVVQRLQGRRGQVKAASERHLARLMKGPGSR